MKFFVVAFALVAVAAATAIDAPSNEYLPPGFGAQAAEEQQVIVEPQDSGVLADDGYRYKTVRRLKYRHRRDVNELPSNEYLPPVASAPVASAPIAEQQVFVEPQESAVLANDGYRYKTVRRLKYRHRRDVNELPTNEYLPPVASAPVASAPIAEQQVFVEPQESAVLANDGYRYKTVRRLKYRHRRDVNELPTNEYLPPVASAPVASAPIAEQQVIVEPQESAVLANDGYRYKTVRRLKYRHRRDVNELPTNEYLPPVASAPIAEQQVIVEPQESAVLADDGYRYKTVRRLKYRHRRDVNELPSNEYLPPVASAPVASAPIAEQQVFVEPQESAVLANDGYRYKTVRRLKYRHRRDVNELPTNEYLPPVASAPVASAPIAEQQVFVEPQESAVLANDGYRYKTVRRLKYRHRRDVNELPSNEYLPPVASAPVASAPIAEQQVFVEPQESAVLANDGYRYKTVRRLKYRHRRDVNELPSNEYLPPVASAPVASAPIAEQQVFVEPQESAVLANDGYRYKTVRRLKYRHRRDVNELPSNEYLPPVASAPVASAPIAEQQVIVEPQESAVLANDGYRYKTVRRLKYRHRRDVNELPTNEYLPPVASAPIAEQQVIVEPQESAVLANDGYRYKTVRRLKYRHRRDVNELPTNEYLPPVASAPVAEQQVIVEPQESAVLADDGYRYKTVRRLKYRHRRV